MSNLNDELQRIWDSFQNSIHRLENFVGLNQRSLDEWRKASKSIKRSFDSAARGRSTTTPLRKGMIEIKLEEDVFHTMRDYMREQAKAAVQFPSMLMEMALIYAIAIFEGFATDIVFAVLKNNPNMLRSGKQLTYEKILEFGSRDDVVSYIARREVSEIGYRSIKEQLAYYDKRLGLDVGASVNVDELVEAMARRNILVHNNGIVNHIYLELTGSSEFGAGERVSVTDQYWQAKLKLFETAAKTMHSHIKKKFALRGRRPKARALRKTQHGSRRN